MAESKAKEIGGHIQQKGFDVELIIPGVKETIFLHAIQHNNRFLTSDNQSHHEATVFFSSAHKDLATLLIDTSEVKWKFSTQSGDYFHGPFNFNLALRPDAITQLPFALRGGREYCYEIRINNSPLILRELLAKRTDVYPGSVKSVIEAALTRCNVSKDMFDLTGLSSNLVTKETTNYYVQQGESTATFIKNILAEYGVTAYLNNNGVLNFIESITSYVKSNITISAKPTMPTTLDNGVRVRALSIYNFSETRQKSGISDIELSYRTEQENTDIRPGLAGDKSGQGAAHALVTTSSLTSDEHTERAKRYLEAETFMQRSFKGLSVYPLELGKTYTIKAEFINGKKETLELAPIAIRMCHTFYAPDAANNNPAVPKFETWTQLPGDQFLSEVIFIEAKYLPRLPAYVPESRPLEFEAIIVTPEGQPTGKPSEKSDVMYIGLLHGQPRKASEKFDPIPVTKHLAPGSLTSSILAPGTLVRVGYDPIAKDFILLERSLVGKYTSVTTIKNDSNASAPSKAEITLTPVEVTATAEKMVTVKATVKDKATDKDKESTLTLTPAEITATADDAITVKTNVKDKESTLTFNAAGANLTTLADIAIKADNISETATANFMLTVDKDRKETIKGNSISDITKDAAITANGNVAIDGKQVKVKNIEIGV